MDIILYEDQQIPSLFPITMTRPGYDVRTGGYTLLEAVKLTFPKASIFSYTRKLVHDISLVPEFSHEAKQSGGFLFLNARLAPSLKTLDDVSAILRRANEDCTFLVNGSVAGFFVGTLTEKMKDFTSYVSTHEAGAVRHDLSAVLFKNPEEVIFFNRDFLGENLTLAAKNLRSKKRGLYAGKDVVFPKEFSYDVTKGPIVIGDHVVIHPFTVLKGPLFIGQSSIIKEFSVISGSTIGPVCKVGGEVEDTVIDGYSNKQHTGGVENSYIGRWVNIGGGTFFSDLKNTYSTITIGGRDSGAQFLGAIMGDFSKTSINTSIFPGKLIGVAAHLYGTVTEDVPAFTSHVRPGVMYELPVGLAEKGQKAMAMRRGVPFTEQDTARMVHVFDKTAAEREAKNVSKEKISFIQ